MQTIFFKDLEKISYREAWDFQTALHRQLVDNKLKNRDLRPGDYPQANTLLLCEHPPVFTLGRSGSMENLLLAEAELAARGIEFFPINRGGDITFHGPGQIVGYPILDLECFFTDVHRYVRCLEEVMILTLADYGVEGFRMNDFTGVWVEGAPKNARLPAGFDPEKKRKICAIGVHLSRWVTLHGWAFNVNTDLRYFDFIVPCGIADGDKTVTSLALELGRELDFQAVKSRVKSHFSRVFDVQFDA